MPIKKNNALLETLEKIKEIEELGKANTASLEHLHENISIFQEMLLVNTETLTSLQDGKVYRRKIVKQDVIDSLKELNSNLSDVNGVYTTIEKCAYYRVRHLIEETFNGLPPLWNQLSPRYSREMLNILNKRVKEMDIDLSLCEDDWIGVHLLKRSYQNRKIFVKK
ncbi:hypothetical protein INT48_009144, partial [Thamnidium elegans]